MSPHLELCHIVWHNINHLNILKFVCCKYYSDFSFISSLICSSALYAVSSRGEQHFCHKAHYPGNRRKEYSVVKEQKNETFICRYRHTTPLGNCLHLQIKVSTLFLILILKHYNIKNSICQELDKPPSGFQRILIQVIAQSLASTSNMNTSEQFRFNLTNPFSCYIKFFCRFY